jgi:YVTN family beta-propeller protein
MYFRIVLSVASLLIYAGIANAAPFAYIANNTDNTVSVLDTASNTVVRVLNKADDGIGDAPSGVAVNRMGSRVYVANSAVSGPYSISVIDTLNNSVSSIPLTLRPGALAVNSAGTRLFVANPYDDSVSVFDTVSKALISTVPASANCQPDGGIVAAPADGSGNYNVYVACVGGTNGPGIDVLNATASTVTKAATSVGLASAPKGLAISKDGKRVYVAGSSTVSLIDTTALGSTPTATLAIPGVYMLNGIAADPSVANSDAPNAIKLYLTDMVKTTGNIAVVNAIGNTLTYATALTGGNGPWGIAYTDDGAKAVTSNYLSSGTVSVITKGSPDTIVTTPPATVGGSPKSFGDFAGPDFVSVTTGVSDGNCGKIDTAELITPLSEIYKVAKGKDVTFNITPYPNCIITEVSIDGGASIGTSSSYTFPATDTNINRSISAKFDRSAWVVAVTFQGDGTGTIRSNVKPSGYWIPGGGLNCGTSCSATNATGTNLQLLATADAGSYFDGWAGSGCSGTMCEILPLNQANAMLLGGDSGTFSITAKFRKNASGPVRMGRGGTVIYKTTLQEANDALVAAQGTNPVDLDKSKDFSLPSSTSNILLVGGWTDWTTNGSGAISGASNITGPFTVTSGSVTIGSYNNLGAIVIK